MKTKTDELIEDFFNLKKTIAELTEKFEDVKDKIKFEMVSNKLDRYLDVNGNMVTYKDQTRKSLNKKLVEQKLAPEVFEQCFKTTTFNVLKVISNEELERIQNMSKKNE